MPCSCSGIQDRVDYGLWMLLGTIWFHGMRSKAPGQHAEKEAAVASNL